MTHSWTKARGWTLIQVLSLPKADALQADVGGLGEDDGDLAPEGSDSNQRRAQDQEAHGGPVSWLPLLSTK